MKFNRLLPILLWFGKSVNTFCENDTSFKDGEGMQRIVNLIARSLMKKCNSSHANKRRYRRNFLDFGTGLGG